jgi:excisionase family DNA binding protein
MLGDAGDGALLVSLNEVRSMLGVSRGTVFRLLDDGELNRVRIRGRTLVPRADVLELIKRSAQTPQSPAA